MSIWDIWPKGRFQFIIPTLLRGATGCLIFFNIMKCPINDLDYWISLFRSYAGEGPIILVGTNFNLNDELNYEEIYNFVETNHLNGFFLLPDQVDLILDELGRKALECRRSRPNITSNNRVIGKERGFLNKFFDFFSTCPVCQGKNHKSHLHEFYFSANPNLKQLKERLVALIEESENFEEVYVNKIKIGIPCCSCFDKFFS